MHLAHHYFLNSVAVVFGETPLGYHGWDLLLTYDNKLTVHFFEPQTDEIWSVQDNEKKRYIPRIVFI